MTKKSKKVSKPKSSSESKKPFLSARQKGVLVVIIVGMFILVPFVDNIRCKAACLKRIKTPYPEIACKYECPWPWEKSR